MNFDFSDEQKQMRDEARKFLSEQCPPKAVREVLDGKAPYDKSLWKGLAEMGFLGIAIPEQFGNHRAAVEAIGFAHLVKTFAPISRCDSRTAVGVQAL